MQQQVGRIDAAELLGAGVDVDELLQRPRRLQQRVAAGRHLAQPRADRQDEIGVGDPLRELRIDADAHIAGVVRMPVVEQVLEAKRAAHGQVPAFGEALQCIAGGRVPAAAADNDERPLCGKEHRAQVAQRTGRGPGLGRLDARQHRRGGGAREHVLGQHQHHRPGAPLQRGVKGARDVLGQTIRVVHLADPFGHAERAGAEHLPVVHLLEGFAVALFAGHLADEQRSTFPIPFRRFSRPFAHCKHVNDDSSTASHLDGRFL